MRARLLLVLGLLAACARDPKPTPDYLAARARADQAERARDRAAHEQALAEASSQCPPKECPLIARRYVEALAANGKTAEAIQAAEALATRYPTSPEAPLALVEAAKLSDASGEGRGRELLYRAARLDPDSAGARRAIERLVARARVQGIPAERRTPASRAACGDAPDCQDPRGDLAALEELALILSGISKESELRTYTLLLRATLFGELGREDEALRDELAILKAGPSYPQFDNASMRAAKRYLARQQPEEAEAILRALLKTRRESWAIGSYHSEFLDDATLLYGDIARDRGDAPEARARYLDVIQHYDDSILRDDAFYRVATLAQLPSSQRCEALDGLLRDQPTSRFIDKANTLRQELGCE